MDFKKEETKESFLKVIFPFVGKENYFRFFGSKGFVESQLLVPDKVLNIFLDEIKYLCKIYEPSITLFSFKIMSGEQKLLRFEGDGTCVTFDFVRNKKNLNFIEKVDQLCIK